MPEASSGSSRAHCAARLCQWPKFCQTLVRLDALCRIASLGTHTEQRMPVFVSFDVKAASPSMSQIWLGWDRSSESFSLSPQ
eukprot:1557251-Pyramimonas_sp.AAC.1